MQNWSVMLQMSQVTDLKVSCEMVQKKAIETRQAEEKVTSKLYETPPFLTRGTLRKSTIFGKLANS